MKTLQPDLKIQTVWDNVWGIVQVRMHARVSLSMCLCLCLPTTHTDPNPSPRPLLRQVVFLPGGKVLTVHKPGELHIYDSILAKSQVGIQTCGCGCGCGCVRLHPRQEPGRGAVGDTYMCGCGCRGGCRRLDIGAVGPV